MYQLLWLLSLTSSISEVTSSSSSSSSKSKSESSTCATQQPCLNITRRSLSDDGQIAAVCLSFDPLTNGCSSSSGKSYNYEKCEVVICGSNVLFSIEDGNGCAATNNLHDISISGIDGVSCSPNSSKKKCKWSIPAGNCPTPQPIDEPSISPTKGPTTSQPTTSAPTTSSPTTSDPTTAEPTTSEPTTADPTTTSPTTAEPTTLEPTTTDPTTADPTTSVPTTANPTTSNPTTASPTTAEPTTSQPTTAYPTTLNPTTAAPTMFVKEYMISDVGFTWGGAREFCLLRGMQLATFDDQDEYQSLFDLCSSILGLGLNGCWLGFNDFDYDGNYTFIDDGVNVESIVADYWVEGDPNAINPLFSCGGIELGPYAEESLRETNCHSDRHAICETIESEVPSPALINDDEVDDHQMLQINDSHQNLNDNNNDDIIITVIICGCILFGLLVIGAIIFGVYKLMKSKEKVMFPQQQEEQRDQEPNESQKQESTLNQTEIEVPVASSINNIG